MNSKKNSCRGNYMRKYGKRFGNKKPLFKLVKKFVKKLGFFSSREEGINN
jgi:hypothetical protein